MATNKVSDGLTVNHTAATGGVTSGAIVLGTDRAGIALNSVTGGATVPLAMVGVYSVTKATATSEGMTFLDKVFAKSTGGSVVASATGTVPLGHAAAAAATGATTVNVLLGPH